MNVSETIELLDHGYVRFIEDWGHGDVGEAEAGIIEAARQSTQGSFRGWDEDRKLLNHLYRNKHFTPFEFAGMTIEVKAPIMVFREWHRHRTQSYNEMSARYAPIPNNNYIPSPNRCMEVSAQNKQAGAVKGSDELTHKSVLEWLQKLDHLYVQADIVYQDGLSKGLPKEIARLPMPVGRYTKMRASANLRNWLAFLTLRMDPSAQWEIRQYANAVGLLISQRFKNTWSLFSEDSL